MNLELLKSEVMELSAADRQKLMAFMVVLEDQEQAEYAIKLAQKIDDKSPDRWRSVEQCARDLGLAGET